MNIALNQGRYGLRVDPLKGQVTAFCDGTVLAKSRRAVVMHETRLPPTIYFPPEDLLVPVSERTGFKTFCPFKGTASYRDLRLAGNTIESAIWSYEEALPESREIRGFVGFMPHVGATYDLGDNQIASGQDGHISGPLIDWLLRQGGQAETPETFTAELARKLVENGVAISRVSVMIWSLHPMIAGKNYIWEKSRDAVSTFAPSYEIHDHPAFVNSPLRHVSNGLGGVRQRLDDPVGDEAFPIMKDLQDNGATDYVAMPLRFSDGGIHVLTLTCDHPQGFSTENLGLVFECSGVIGRFYEVFMQRENARSLLETYVGKRSGARVLGGEIRRGDGDEIDAAIMFCDLRDSTRWEETMGRDEYLALLNDFFETASSIVHDHGGEVLKFIGDAVLAVFPADRDTNPDAARRQSVAAARNIVDTLDENRNETSGPHVDCAIGLAFGRVTYGNIGSRSRLDFTVIGQAANIAARLGEVGKTAGYRIVTTEDVAASAGQMTPLGVHKLHNVSRSIACHAAFPTGRDDSATDPI